MLACAPLAAAEVDPEFPVCLNTGEQADLVAIPDGAGGAYAAWTDYGADPGGNVHVVRLNAGGVAPGWPLGGIPLATSGTAEHLPQLVRDGSGGVICVWQVPLTSGIHTLYAARLSATGLFLWGSLPRAVSPMPEEYARLPASVAVTPDDAGGVWVSYLGIRGLTGVEALPRAHHLNAVGILDVEQPLTTIPTVTPGGTGIARDSSGAVMVVWSETQASSGDANLRIQRLLADGVRDPRFHEDGELLGGSLGSQYAPTLVADGAGGAYAGWLDQVGVDPEVTVLRLGPDGRARFGWPAKGIALTEDHEWQEAPLLRATPDGRVLAAWIDRRTGTPDVRLGSLRADGTLPPGWNPTGQAITGIAAGERSSPAFDVLGDGSLIAAWDSGPTGGPRDVYGVVVTALGGATPGPEAGVIRADPAVDESHPVVVADPAGGALVLWLDRRGGEADIYGRHVQFGVVLDAPRGPTGLSLAGARPSPVRDAGARLAFALPDGAAATLALYDLAGRRLWSRGVGVLGAGAHEVPIGARLAPGLYFARLTRGGSAVGARVVVTE